jgi:hypothetical protein
MTDSTKEIIILSDIHYTDILASTELPGEYPPTAISLYHIVNSSRIPVPDLVYVDSDNDTLIEAVEWIVPSLSNQTYELSIEVLNIHSYPSVGGNWTVRFDTMGTANLTITGIGNTTWAELLTDDNVTEDDLEFLDLQCGNESLKSSLQLISFERNTNLSSLSWFTNLTTNNSLAVDSLFVQDFTCNSTAHLRNRELYGGHHALFFRFGDVNGTAYNYASQLDCIINSTGSCDDRYTDIFHMSSMTNAHAELNNQSGYSYAVCCREEYGETIWTNCSMPKAETILRLESLTNSHVEKSSESNYQHEVCMAPSDNYNISCSYDTSCTGSEVCVASISSSEIGFDTNLQVGNCTDGYQTLICCDTGDDTDNQDPYTGCVIPYDDLRINQSVTFCPGHYYLEDESADGLLHLDPSIVPYVVQGRGTVIQGDDTGYGFYAGSSVREVTIQDINISDYSNSIYFVDGIDNMTMRNISVNSSTYGIYAYSTGPVFENITVQDSKFYDNTRSIQLAYTQSSLFEYNYFSSGSSTYAFFTWDSMNNTYVFNTMQGSMTSWYSVDFHDNNVSSNVMTGGSTMVNHATGPGHRNVYHNNTFQGTRGVSTGWASYNNTWTNNTFDITNLAIHYGGGTGNLVYYNNFSGSPSPNYITMLPNNHLNTTVDGAAHGNLWSNIGELSIYDTDGDGFADDGFQYPYNNTNGGLVNIYVQDWGMS